MSDGKKPFRVRQSWLTHMARLGKDRCGKCGKKFRLREWVVSRVCSVGGAKRPFHRACWRSLRL